MAKPPSINLGPYADRLQALRSRIRKTAHVLRLPNWFPHAPLALALAGGGMALLMTAS